MHELFTVPAAQVTRAMLDSFLAMQLPEGYMVEYKSAIDPVLDAVASMVNTYGGLVLVGIEPAGDRPGPVKGVRPSDRDALVNKMVTQYDPPWTPEVIPVDLETGAVVLVVRVFSDRAPRPLMHKGRVLVRVEGRKVTANLRLIRLLLDEARPADLPAGGDPPHNPRLHASPIRHHEDDPSLVVRAYGAGRLWPGVVRPRIDASAARAIAEKLNDSYLPELLSKLREELSCEADLRRGWGTQRANRSSRVVRLWLGTASAAGDLPHSVPGVRADCLVQIGGDRRSGGGVVAVDLDVALWLRPGYKLPPDRLKEIARYAVTALVEHAVPAAMLAIGGTDTPLIEQVALHVATGPVPGRPKDGDNLTTASLLDLVDLAVPDGYDRTRQIALSSEWLDPDLLAAGLLPDAVSNAFQLMKLDWGLS